MAISSSLASSAVKDSLSDLNHSHKASIYLQCLFHFHHYVELVKAELEN